MNKITNNVTYQKAFMTYAGELYNVCFYDLLDMPMIKV